MEFSTTTSTNIGRKTNALKIETPPSTSSPENPPGGNDGGGNDSWKTAVGVSVPLIILLSICIVAYILYRKKYPVRMILGREFAKFRNPNYDKPRSEATLVRDDADSYFRNSTTASTMNLDEYNPVNATMHFGRQNLGYQRDDDEDEHDDENPEEREFRLKKGWLFRKSQAEEDSVEVVIENEDQKPVEITEPSKSDNASQKSIDSDVEAMLSEQKMTPVPVKKNRKQFNVSDSDEKSSRTHSDASSLSKNSKDAAAAQNKESLPTDTVDGKVKMKFLGEALIDTKSVRSLSLTIPTLEIKSRPRAASFDVLKSARGISLKNDVLLSPDIFFTTSDSKLQPVSASVVAAVVRSSGSLYSSTSSLSSPTKERINSLSSNNSIDNNVSDCEEVGSINYETQNSKVNVKSGSNNDEHLNSSMIHIHVEEVSEHNEIIADVQKRDTYTEDIEYKRKDSIESRGESSGILGYHPSNVAEPEYENISSLKQSGAYSFDEEELSSNRVIDQNNASDSRQILQRGSPTQVEYANLPSLTIDHATADLEDQYADVSDITTTQKNEINTSVESEGTKQKLESATKDVSTIEHASLVIISSTGIKGNVISSDTEESLVPVDDVSQASNASHSLEYHSPLRGSGDVANEPMKVVGKNTQNADDDTSADDYSESEDDSSTSKSSSDGHCEEYSFENLDQDNVEYAENANIENSQRLNTELQPCTLGNIDIIIPEKASGDHKEDIIEDSSDLAQLATSSQSYQNESSPLTQSPDSDFTATKEKALVTEAKSNEDDATSSLSDSSLDVDDVSLSDIEEPTDYRPRSQKQIHEKGNDESPANEPIVASSHVTNPTGTENEAKPLQNKEQPQTPNSGSLLKIVPTVQFSDASSDTSDDHFDDVIRGNKERGGEGRQFTLDDIDAAFSNQKQSLKVTDNDDANDSTAQIDINFGNNTTYHMADFDDEDDIDV